LTELLGFFDLSSISKNLNVSLNRDFSKSINYQIISKLSEKFASNSEIFGVNFIKIGPAMTSGYLFEKMKDTFKFLC
jgi:hypothetical protein